MIEKITDQNLERYDSRLKEWCDRKFFEKGNYGKYQTTEEAGAVAFYPAPNTLLEGKVKFSFKETVPTNGDKSLDNPSTITGISSVKMTRYGKNLLIRPYVQSTTTTNGVTFTVNDDGTITVNGTASDVTRFYLSYSSMGAIYKNGLTYMLSGCPSGGAVGTYYLGVVGPILNNSWNVDLGAGKSFTPDGDGHLACAIVIASGTTVSNLVFKPQLELGSTATAFELYNGADYTINLGDTHYGGEIDFATGVMTVTYVCVELKGTETWENITGYNSSTGLGYSRCYPEGISGKKSSIDFPNFSDPSLTYKFYSCSHFPVIRMFSDIPIQNGTLTIPCMWYTAGTDTQNGQARFAVPFSNVADLKAWLAAQKTAGTPVMLVYKIYKPFTIQLSPIEILSLAQINKYTPKLNTVYTDADSVQISYLKSPIRDEYEKTQAILSLGGNS